ncbi:hypothetical protein EJB05_00952, partial [Eragrostis curvula]
IGTSPPRRPLTSRRRCRPPRLPSAPGARCSIPRSSPSTHFPRLSASRTKTWRRWRVSPYPSATAATPRPQDTRPLRRRLRLLARSTAVSTSAAYADSTPPPHPPRQPHTSTCSFQAFSAPLRPTILNRKFWHCHCQNTTES